MIRLITVLLFLSPALLLHSQSIGIVNGIPYGVDPRDTTESSWLPMFNQEPAGTHGFVERGPVGRLRFADGTPARFFGTSLEAGACFPDSATAIITARHLRKIGVNMVRLRYFDHAYSWLTPDVTILDEGNGFRSLHPVRIQRFDWFLSQLFANGIHVYLPLQSARVPTAGDLGPDADSALYLDKSLNYLYPAATMVNRTVARAILDHVNPFTGRAYRNEPGIAVVEVAHEGSLASLYRINYTEYRAGEYGFSWRHSRRLDTLWVDYLKRRYGSTAAMSAAWASAVPDSGGPNVVTEGGFEGEFDRYWEIQGYDGTTVTTILTQADSTPEGALAAKLRVRGTQGNIYTGYMRELVPLQFGKAYTLTFMAKCTNPSGRRLIVNAYNNESGLGSGLNASLDITPWWSRHSRSFLVPISSSAPSNLIFYFGDVDGDLLIDDIELREIPLIGRTPNESLEAVNVARIPWGHEANYAVTEQRLIDQTDFYIGLERSYLDGMRSYVRDSIGARQLTTGASNYWASGFLETDIGASSDVISGTGYWDYVFGNNHPWQVFNYSPLRAEYAGALYSLAGLTRKNIPFLAHFSQPYPNRYQAESMTMIPAYALHQGWDGVTIERYTDEGTIRPSLAVDSLRHFDTRYNPVVEAMSPMAALVLRNGLLKQAATTLALQRTARQVRLYPRFERIWGYYGVPGGFPGFGPALYRIVADSTNATEFSQLADLGFPSGVPGEVQSDTREILWEFQRGDLQIDAPRVQGASGYLYRAGGIPLRNLDVTLLTTNETATILWASTDTSKRLDGPGRSFLTIISRAERQGMRWLDSSYADIWGAGPMVVDPVHVRLNFRPADSVNVATIQPLDSTGRPLGDPMRIVRKGNGITATIDQRQLHAVWFAVELSVDPSASVGAPDAGADALTVRPNIVNDHCVVDLTLARPQHARVELFDPLGRRIALLYDGPVNQGVTPLPVTTAGLGRGLYVVHATMESGETRTTTFTVIR